MSVASEEAESAWDWILGLMWIGFVIILLLNSDFINDDSSTLDDISTLELSVVYFKLWYIIQNTVLT